MSVARQWTEYYHFFDMREPICYISLTWIRNAPFFLRLHNSIVNNIKTAIIPTRITATTAAATPSSVSDMIGSSEDVVMVSSSSVGC